MHQFDEASVADNQVNGLQRWWCTATTAAAGVVDCICSYAVIVELLDQFGADKAVTTAPGRTGWCSGSHALAESGGDHGGSSKERSDSAAAHPQMGELLLLLS